MSAPYGRRKAASGSRRQSRFSEIPQPRVPRSVFDRSSNVKLSLNGGFLVPFWVDEALPGDTFQMQPNIFGRLSTPLHAVMDQLHMEAFFFAVPNRILQDNWVKLQGEQANPADHINYLAPTMTAPGGGYATHSLSDYLGLPVGQAGIVHNSYWHRAYNLIYNEFFRDENLQDSVVVDKDDGPDDPADYVLLRRGKRKDYVTSALPWPQKGDAVSLPLGTDAPVYGIGVQNNTAYSSAPTLIRETEGTGTVTYTGAINIDPAGGAGANASAYIEEDPNNTGFPNIYADLSAASAATINELRVAFQTQKMLEKDARGGTRYTEILQSHFGVSIPDQRWRPELLGTFSVPLEMAIVPAMMTFGTVPQGATGGFGVFGHQGRGWYKSFQEHSVLLGLVSVRAPLTYQQNIHRRFSRSSRYDWYFPSFAHLGEQAVLNKEVFADGSANDDLTFGYQERYAEYRYGENRIAGILRSDTSGALPSLDPWHLAQDFASLPALNASFIEDNPPIDRVVVYDWTADDTPHIIMDASLKLKCARPMPIFGVPGLIDHF